MQVPVAPDGAAKEACASPLPPVLMGVTQCVDALADVLWARTVMTSATATPNASNRLLSIDHLARDQLDHASVAGLVVAVAVPPVAVTPVSDGIEKYVLAHAAGVAVVILASLVNVTTKGLFA
jgi:hypothetical protein